MAQRPQQLRLGRLRLSTRLEEGETTGEEHQEEETSKKQAKAKA
jgi:hypothetical protein